MVKDKKGNAHPNIQRAMASDRMAGGSPVRAAAKPMGEKDGSGSSPAGEDGEPTMTIHSHGDGTHHSVTADGERTEHPHAGHLAAHVAHHHMPEAKHMVHSHDGISEHTTHHVAEDGETQGPHSHANLEAVKDHLNQFFNEEEGEKGWGGESGQASGAGGGY